MGGFLKFEEVRGEECYGQGGAREFRKYGGLLLAVSYFTAVWLFLEMRLMFIHCFLLYCGWYMGGVER